MRYITLANNNKNRAFFGILLDTIIAIKVNVTTITRFQKSWQVGFGDQIFFPRECRRGFPPFAIFGGCGWKDKEMIIKRLRQQRNSDEGLVCVLIYVKAPLFLVLRS